MPPQGASKSSPAKKSTSNDRPSSPTSLLWAHQLKREHAFLLQKMDNLENGIKTLERNAKKNDSDQNIAAIAEQVQALTGGGDIQRVRKEVMKNIEGLQGDLQSVILQVAELARQNDQNLDAKKKQFEAEKKVLKRVKDVEDGLAESQRLLKEMGEIVNEEKMDIIRADLQEIMEKVREEGSTTKKIGESLKVLEDVARVLKEDNEKVAGEVRELREGAVVVAPANGMQDVSVARDAGAGMEKSKATKKTAPKRKVKAETAAFQRPRRGKLGRELANLQINDNTHQDGDAGHTADIDKKPAVRKGRGGLKVNESSEEQPALAAPAAVLTQDASGTVKRGRGAAKRAGAVVATIELSPKRGPARTRGTATQASQAPAKRGPGRLHKDVTQASQAPPRPVPKRRNLEREDNEDEPAAQSQPSQANAEPTRKRNADTLLDEFISPPEPNRAARAPAVKLAPAGAKKKPQLRRGQTKPEESPSPPSPRPEIKKGARRGLTNIWSQSPISSSMSEGETQEAFGPGPEPALKRRNVKEESDEDDSEEEELLRRLSRGEEV